jgi:hypothetical protein
MAKPQFITFIHESRIDLWSIYEVKPLSTGVLQLRHVGGKRISKFGKESHHAELDTRVPGYATALHRTHLDARKSVDKNVKSTTEVWGSYVKGAKETIGGFAHTLHKLEITEALKGPVVRMVNRVKSLRKEA